MSGVIGTDSSNAMPSGEEPLPRLKKQITTKAYRIDAKAVAREMVFKMRMMALLRISPGPGAGRTRTARAPIRRRDAARRPDLP